MIKSATRRAYELMYRDVTKRPHTTSASCLLRLRQKLDAIGIGEASRSVLLSNLVKAGLLTTHGTKPFGYTVAKPFDYELILAYNRSKARDLTPNPPVVAPVAVSAPDLRTTLTTLVKEHGELEVATMLIKVMTGKKS